MLTREIDVVKKDMNEKLKIFRESVTSAAGAGADNGKNHEEWLQDMAGMSRKISSLKNAMEYELGIRDGVHADKKGTLLAMCDNHRRMYSQYTKSCFRDKDSQRTYILIPKRKTLAKTTSTPLTPNDDEE